MEIPKNASAAIVVDNAWANMKAIRLLLRNATDRENMQNDGGHLIWGAVIDTDREGVWVELGEHEESKQGRGVVLIPWRVVISIALYEKHLPELWRDSQIGFSG
jgi:hypothetical protein